jgi:hypothetical protein
MRIASKKRGWKPSGICRYPAITTDAGALGVSTSHLWKCLAGQRQSISLLARYTELENHKASNRPHDWAAQAMQEMIPSCPKL